MTIFDCLNGQSTDIITKSVEGKNGEQKNSFNVSRKERKNTVEQEIFAKISVLQPLMKFAKIS